MKSAIVFLLYAGCSVCFAQIGTMAVDGTDGTTIGQTVTLMRQGEIFDRQSLRGQEHFPDDSTAKISTENDLLFPKGCYVSFYQHRNSDTVSSGRRMDSKNMRTVAEEPVYEVIELDSARALSIDDTSLKIECKDSLMNIPIRNLVEIRLENPDEAEKYSLIGGLVGFARGFAGEFAESRPLMLYVHVFEGIAFAIPPGLFGWTAGLIEGSDRRYRIDTVPYEIRRSKIESIFRNANKKNKDDVIHWTLSWGLSQQAYELSGVQSADGNKISGPMTALTVSAGISVRLYPNLSSSLVFGQILSKAVDVAGLGDILRLQSKDGENYYTYAVKGGLYHGISSSFVNIGADVYLYGDDIFSISVGPRCGLYYWSAGFYEDRDMNAQDVISESNGHTVGFLGNIKCEFHGYRMSFYVESEFSSVSPVYEVTDVLMRDTRVKSQIRLDEVKVSVGVRF